MGKRPAANGRAGIDLFMRHVVFEARRVRQGENRPTFARRAGACLEKEKID
jgi:hypothetical protein